MDENNRNLLLAVVLSLALILTWQVLFPPPDLPVEPDTVERTESAPGAEAGDAALVPGSADPTTTKSTNGTASTADPAEKAPRVAIETPTLKGSVSLRGGRIDDLKLKNYRETLDPDAPIVTLLSPIGSEHAYYALFGWAPGQGLNADQVPNANTIWQVASQGDLTPENPLKLEWQNGAGLIFEREMSVDEKSMFSVRQSVRNTTAETRSLAPYGILARHGEPTDLRNFFILHEGAISIADGKLIETDYGDFEPAGQHEDIAIEETGWTGFTDHFWMTTLIPGQPVGSKISTLQDVGRNIFQTTLKQPTQTLAPGAEFSIDTRLFAGAKEWQTIRDYEAGYETSGLGNSFLYGLGLKEKSGVERFVDAIDWGWFAFLTKPIFWLLHQLNVAIGNMGWAIIALTLIIKAILLPLAFKSYVSMAKMKELQPEMMRIKESAGDDRQKMQKEMMALYKKEKVNPASGCLPILLQIPIFFSLYKVIFVTLELRHAPWIGWIKDLSAPDPSSIYNLWGIFPWTSPEPGSILALIFIGILPVALGISMWLQQKLNPAPTDPTQQMIFAWMPWVFMFMLGSFASGLVIYWIANNMITFAQQYIIMRSQGYSPDVFGNIKAGFKKKPKPEDK